jgi:hypothetical protein
MVWREQKEGGCGRAAKSGVGNAISENVESGKFFHANDAGADEQRRLAGVIRNGDFNGGVFVVSLQAAERKAAFGNVVALDDVFAREAQADAGGEVNASAHVAAEIDFAARGKFRLRRCGRQRRSFFDGEGNGGGHRRKFGGENEIIEDVGGGVGGFWRGGSGKKSGGKRSEGCKGLTRRVRNWRRLGARRRRRAGGFFPGSGQSAGLAITQDGLAGDKDVRFDFRLPDVGAFVAEATFKIDAGMLDDGLGRRRKFNFPEIESGVRESDAVNVAARFFAQAADEADVGFAAGIGVAHSQHFVGSELIAGENARAVAAEDEGMRFLGKDASTSVRSKKHDGDLLCNATTSAHTRHIGPPTGP